VSGFKEEGAARALLATVLERRLEQEAFGALG